MYKKGKRNFFGMKKSQLHSKHVFVLLGYQRKIESKPLKKRLVYYFSLYFTMVGKNPIDD